MALLQIAEPGQSAAPHQHKVAVGIDLGTTNSLVATVRNGMAEILCDEQDRPLLPSVVHFSACGHIDVGYSALAKASDNPQNTVISVKRLLGRSLTDITARYSDLPYEFEQTQHALPFIKTAQGLKSPVEVSAEILKKLTALAHARLNNKPLDAVITVPAYFDDAQRQSTKDAATLAGLNVLRLLNEPTAAAIAYGLDSGQEGVIAVYDLGGGTFDISVLRLTKGVFEVLSTGGDSALGGDDFDQVLADWISTQSGIIPDTPQEIRHLSLLAKQIKTRLTDTDNIKVQYAHWQGEITRTLFNELISPLVKRTLLVCRRALKDAQVNIEEINDIVLVGGSTRVPYIRSEVEAFFGKPPLTALDPDKVVALGAAVQADILIGNKPDTEMLLLDVIPLSLGIETMGGIVEKIIPRNTTIPVAKAQEFTTFKDGQTAMTVHIVQGEREMATHCRSLARFTLRGIPPMVAGAAHIRVTYQVDADGLLSVTALEKATGIQASVQVKPSYGLTDEEVADMLKSSMENAKEDMQQRLLAEQRIEADRVIESVRNALHEDSHLLTQNELSAVQNALDFLETVKHQEDIAAIKQGIMQLDQATQEFAARRMNQSIQRALSGHSIEQFTDINK